MSSLGDFLNTMYKKRELEYKAELDQANADVAGAKAIGEGISSIGSAVGGIGKGLGGYMQQSQLDKAAISIGQEGGHPLTSTGFGASDELKMRMAANQFPNTATTPYQQAMLGLGIDRENRLRQASNEARATAAGKEATSKFTDSVKNAEAYQTATTANYEKLLGANTEEEFNNYSRYQNSLNQGAFAAGIDQSLIKQVPDRWIPPKQSQVVNDYSRAFADYSAARSVPAPAVRGVGQPGPIAQASEALQESGFSGNMPKYSTGIPAGAIPEPTLRGSNIQPGTPGRKGGKDYTWAAGGYWVPATQ